METVGQTLLTKLQTHHGGCTLHALHNILCISSQYIYQIANGNRGMSTDTILIACDILGEDPRPWLIQAEIQTCQSPKRREILRRLFDELNTPAGRAIAGLLVFMVLPFSGFSPA